MVHLIRPTSEHEIALAVDEKPPEGARSVMMGFVVQDESRLRRLSIGSREP